MNFIPTRTYQVEKNVYRKLLDIDVTPELADYYYDDSDETRWSPGLADYYGKQILLKPGELTAYEILEQIHSKDLLVCSCWHDYWPIPNFLTNGQY